MKIVVGRKDAIWGYAATALSMCINLIMLPMILSFLNDDSVGLYYIFTSLGGLSSFFDAGFTPSIARSMVYAWSGAKELSVAGVKPSEGLEPNYALMKKIMGACNVIYGGLSSIVIILLLTLGTFYIRYVSVEIDGSNHLIAWIIYAFAISLNILYGYYSALLRGVGAVAKVNKATVVARIIQVVVCAVMLVCGFGLVGVAVAYIVYGLCFRLISKKWYYAYCNLGDALKKEKKANKTDIINIIKIIWPNTWREGTVSISNYIVNQSTTVLSSLYLSLYETGLFSLAIQLTQAIASISSSLYLTYQPALQSAYANRDKEEQRKCISVIITTFVFVYVIGIIALLTIGRPLIALIKPSYTLSTKLLLGTGLYQFILKYRNSYVTYFSSTNRLFYNTSFFLSAILCLILSVALTGFLNLGITGLVIGQIFSQAVYNAWYWPKKAHKELELSVTKLFVIGVSNCFTTWSKKER